MVSKLVDSPSKLFLHSLPFVLSTMFALYYVPDKVVPTLSAMAVKCTPVTSLIYLLCQVTSEDPTKGHKKRIFSRNLLRKNILPGLVCSLLGDAFLIAHENFYLFLAGLVLFAIAHIFYIRALGFKPLNLPVGVFLYIVSVVSSFIITFHIDIFNKVAMICYSLIIATMVWRAICRYDVKDTGALWQKWSLILGAITFCVSDITIAVFKYKIEATPVEAQSTILSTYYLAQFLIVLGVL